MAMRNMGKQEAYLPEQIQKYRDGSDSDNYPNVNHLKWLLESGSGFNTNIILAYKEEMLRRVIIYQ